MREMAGHSEMRGQWGEVGRCRRCRESDTVAVCLPKQTKHSFDIASNKSSYSGFNIQYILHVFTNGCAAVG